jgi:hypothetical protein
LSEKPATIALPKAGPRSRTFHRDEYGHLTGYTEEEA